MKRLAPMTLATFALALAGPAQATEALAKSSGCLTCHNVTGARKIGPSFQETAAKYKGKADAEASVMAKLADAKKHPASKAKPEEIKALVGWILAM